MIYMLAIPGPIEDVRELRVLEWHRTAGQAVEAGNLVVELETHKAIVEIRAGQSGTLREVLVAEGGWCAIGQPLALLSDAADEVLPADTETATLMAVTFEVS